MAIDSISNPFLNTATSFGGQTEHLPGTGSFMGRVVSQAATPESLLADAAEELAFAADTTDDFELEERKERDRAGKAQDERVRLYQELMHQAGKGAEISRLRDGLRARADQQRALDKAREHFPDPSDAWAALKELLEEFRASGADRSIVSDIEEAVAELEEREGPAVRAGIQGALSAAGFPELGSSDDMRDFYRETVCDFTTVMEVFDRIRQEYGGDFERSMDFLFSALSADLASDSPSMGIRHLENVNTSLGKVRLTQSAYRLCEGMLERWGSVHGIRAPRCSLSAFDLLGSVMEMGAKRFLGAMQVEPLLPKSGAPDIEHEVLFLQELLNTARKFPSTLFDDEQGRSRLLDAVQEAVDKAVEREDEWLASQEG